MSNITARLKEIAPTYVEACTQAAENPNDFWLEAASLIDWTTPPTRALDDSRPPFYRWFPDAELNVCYNALDRHVEAGRGSQVALIHDSAVTSAVTTYTYDQLLDQVSRLARALADKGITKGDRVIIYMPMIAEAAVAMLACARLGAIHSVVFGGFSAHELAVRIDDLGPKALISTSCALEGKKTLEYKPLIDAALERANHTPEFAVILQREQAPCELTEGRDFDYAQLLEATPDGIAPVPVKATDELYVLYTSGTTGKPKGIVRDCGGYAVALTWSLGAIFDLNPGDTMFTASDVGWVVGHSYIVYGPLLGGVTTVMLEGKPVGTPDASTFFRIVDEHNVNVFFGAPTAMRVIRKEDPEGAFMRKYAMEGLHGWFQAGERLDPETYQWTTQKLAEATGRNIPVVDNWWQTETGWPIAANPLGLGQVELKAGSPSLPVPGYQVEVIDPGGADLGPGQEGLIVIKLPLPPGTLPTVWGDESRFEASYLSAFKGYYLTGDSGYIDEDGYVFIMGRTDDIINVAGHRLSTGAMEAAIAAHPAVAECAVIGVADPVKGQMPRAFVVLKDLPDLDVDSIRGELVERVREDIGPVAALKRVDVVEALPKTRSGKILRKTMREIADGDTNAAVPSTIEDISVLDKMRDTLGKQ